MFLQNSVCSLESWLLSVFRIRQNAAMVSSLSMAHDHLGIYSNSADFILTDDELKHTVEVYTKQCKSNQSASLMKVERHEWSVWIL